MWRKIYSFRLRFYKDWIIIVFKAIIDLMQCSAYSFMMVFAITLKPKINPDESFSASYS